MLLSHYFLFLLLDMLVHFKGDSGMVRKVNLILFLLMLLELATPHCPLDVDI